MSNGWDESSGAWIRAMGERGDFGREHVLDPVMMEQVPQDVSRWLSMLAAVKVASVAC
jgi:hypothetical protein